MGVSPHFVKNIKLSQFSKTKGKSEGKNYHPIALLSVDSKVLEKVVFIHILKYFNSNKLINPNHHGFRENHSTSTAIIQMYDMWVKAADKGKLSGALISINVCGDQVNETDADKYFVLS